MTRTKYSVLFLFNLFLSQELFAQTDLPGIFQDVNYTHKLAIMGIQKPALVKDFYQTCRYQAVWINAGRHSGFVNLVKQLKKAPGLALNEKDYHYQLLKSLDSNLAVLKTADDSLRAELCITDAALQFFSEVQNGNVAPVLRYDGLNYQPTDTNIPSMLALSIEKGDLDSLAMLLEPKSLEYHVVKERLAGIDQLMSDKNFEEVIIPAANRIKKNLLLVKKLFQLGMLTSADTLISNAALAKGVINAQQLFNIAADGKPGSQTLKALNVPLSKRKKELILAMNYLRWLEQIKKTQPIILVNIPSASLLVYDSGKVKMESRIIVGKSATPTPTLSSKVTEIIAYPYWSVPEKIARTELLPAIKRNIGYLEQNNFQVLNEQGRRINPNSINWSTLTAANFPYKIRQSTGCDNSLGIIKLNFYNPFTVYLHDTPFKSLFMLNKRYFSHGCMRVEKVIDLARLVLRDNSIAVDTITEKGCILSQSPVVIPVTHTMNVMVIYSTVWHDKFGQVKYYDDVYQKIASITGRK